jgi:hypothetical protein
VYDFHVYNKAVPLESQVLKSVERAINWFDNADMFVCRYDRFYGVKEGLGHAVYPDGKQTVNEGLRGDCIGETSLAFFMYHKLTGDKRSLEIANGLMEYFEAGRVKDDPSFLGMTGGHVCYQDDYARGFIFPALFRKLYNGDDTYMDLCIKALKFLVKTTGTDGLRVARTDRVSLNDDIVRIMNIEAYDEDKSKKWRWYWPPNEHAAELANRPGICPSAHYNGYYLASLLFAYKMTGVEEFKTTGIKGLETLMSYYPATAREHSETQELCRLILPLSMLYWVTRDQKHKDWLYKVVSDLQKYRHYSNGYLEWDTGYIATCSRKKNGECLVLSSNGDPVTDMLYSNNWLPVGFIQAYFVTRDEYFIHLWEQLAEFLISTQITSKNRMIEGAWVRGVDVELMEVFGVPNDVGWAPWSVESGWTIGEIITGLTMGLLKNRLNGFYL